MSVWIELAPHGMELTGYLPSMLDDRDERPAREQLHANYAHGGGWRPMRGFTIDPKTYVLTFPEDPPYRPVAFTVLLGTKETVVVYQYSIVVVIQADGTFEAARMD